MIIVSYLIWLAIATIIYGLFLSFNKSNSKQFIKKELLSTAIFTTLFWVAYKAILFFLGGN